MPKWDAMEFRPRNPKAPQEDTAMNRVCSIFSQVLQFIPRTEFAAAVEEHKAEPVSYTHLTLPTSDLV